MILTSALHPLLTDKMVALLKQFSVANLSQLLSLPPERLCSILNIPFAQCSSMISELFREHSSFPRVGLEAMQSSLDEEFQLETGSTSLDSIIGRDVYSIPICNSKFI